MSEKIPQVLREHLLDQPVDRGLVERYFEQVKRHPEIAKGTNRSAQRRLVWFVAISGFAVLNGQVLWSALMRRTVDGTDLLVLAIPWVVTALLSIAAHILIDQVEVYDNLAFEMKYASLNILLDKFDKKQPVSGREFMDILGEETDQLREAGARLKPWLTWARRAENWAQVALFISFLWMLVGPLLLG